MSIQDEKSSHLPHLTEQVTYIKDKNDRSSKMYNVLGRPSNAPISDTTNIRSVACAFEKSPRHNNRRYVQIPPGSLSPLFSGDRKASPFFFSSPFPCNQLQMDEHIYFAVGFKAYNIRR